MDDCSRLVRDAVILTTKLAPLLILVLPASVPFLLLAGATGLTLITSHAAF